MSIPSTIFLRPDPPTRPSHSDSRDRIPSDLALPRFLHERAVLELQLAECGSLQRTLLDVRRRRKNGQNTLSGHTELAEGFFVKTEIQDTESFIVSLGIEGAHVELELEEAVAYAQRRENFLRVALERVKDRIKGLEAELKMDMAQMDELLQQLR